MFKFKIGQRWLRSSEIEGLVVIEIIHISGMVGTILACNTELYRIGEIRVFNYIAPSTNDWYNDSIRYTLLPNQDKPEKEI